MFRKIIITNKEMNEVQIIIIIIIIIINNYINNNYKLL